MHKSVDDSRGIKIGFFGLSLYSINTVFQAKAEFVEPKKDEYL